MNGHRQGDVVRVGGDARQRYYDARGYGRPLSGNEVELSLVEAAHLLFRGDLEAVDGMGFRAFFAQAVADRDRFGLRFLVYSDLRERGFYLSPARDGWPGTEGEQPYDFAVYERGSGPDDGAVEHRVQVVGERETVDLAPLAGRVLAVVDEESEITYLNVETFEYDGDTRYAPPDDLEGDLLEDRVLCWGYPSDLYERGFYGQPLSGRGAVGVDALQLSLVEAAALAAEGGLDLGAADDDYDAVVDLGRAVEGDRFDRRLRVYTALRERGVVPKTGFKFGADFRTYADVTSVEALGHSETLVRVLPGDHVFDPRALSLDVRLAGGVRKRMVFALTGANGGIDWLSVARLTP